MSTLTEMPVEERVPGVWRLTVTAGLRTFDSMICFSRAGTLVEIAAPRAEGSLGVWAAEPDGFRYTMHAYVHDNPPDQPPVTIHTVRARGTFTGPDSFEGAAMLIFRNAEDDAVLFTAEPTFVGTRVTA